MNGGVRAEHDHREVGSARIAPQGGQHPVARMIRQLEIQEDQAGAVLPCLLQAGGTGARRQELPVRPLARRHHLHQLQVGGVVLDAEQGDVAFRRGILGKGKRQDAGCFGDLGRGMAEGQLDPEAAAPTRFTFHSDAAAERLHEPPRDRQPQSRAFDFAVLMVQTLERGEQPGNVVGGDSEAGIADADQALVFRGPAATQADPSTGPVVFDGVGEQVEQDLTQPLFIGPERR